MFYSNMIYELKIKFYCNILGDANSYLITMFDGLNPGNFNIIK